MFIPLCNKTFYILTIPIDIFLKDLTYFPAFFEKKELTLNLANSYRFSHNMNTNCCALILRFLTSACCHLLMTVGS